MFNLNYVAAALGTTVESGGLSLYESPSQGENVTNAGQIPIPMNYTPVAYQGSMIGWYKKPSDNNWSVGTISGNTMSAPSAQIGENYCVKFFYTNENAKSITIKANYVPKVLHIVMLFDLFSGSSAEIENAEKYGRLIVDVPSFQLDGSQNLSLTSTSAATVSLTGSALAMDSGDTCEEDLVYGTMTQEIFGATWKDEVVALAFADSEIEMGATDTATLQVYVVYGNGMASQIKDNSNFTFAIETTPASTTSSIEVGANDGVIETTSATAGNCVISASLTGYNNVSPALATVVVSTD